MSLTFFAIDRDRIRRLPYKNNISYQRRDSNFKIIRWQTRTKVIGKWFELLVTTDTSVSLYLSAEGTQVSPTAFPCSVSCHAPSPRTTWTSNTSWYSPRLPPPPPYFLLPFETHSRVLENQKQLCLKISTDTSTWSTCYSSHEYTSNTKYLKYVRYQEYET